MTVTGCDWFVLVEKSSFVVSLGQSRNRKLQYLLQDDYDIVTVGIVTCILDVTDPNFTWYDLTKVL